MQPYILRPAQKSDHASIRSIIRRVGINPMDLNWRHFLVAKTYDGEFIGCGQLKKHKDGSIELASLAVEEKNRGQGVARAIIEQLISTGPRPLYLMCRPELGSLYEKFGFRAIVLKEMPPYFQRILKMLKVLTLPGKPSGPLVMRLD